MVSQTSFACSIQESRPLLTGVNIKVNGDNLECIATDSYRLSKVIIKLNKSYDENTNIVVPAKNINEFIKTIEKDEELEIHTFANKAIFRHGNLIFQTSLLNGTYPNTDNSFPKEYKYEIELNLKDFYNILDRASLITQSKDKNIIDFDLNGNNIVIKASSQEMGKVEEKMSVVNKIGNNIKISFSAKYMIEALKIFKEKKIYLLLNGEISPIIVKEENNDELIQLILPMKTY